MSTMTTNMNLIVPAVGTEPGPDWATEINADIGILDQHNHSSGQGVQITPAGLNINADLPLNSNNLTTVRTVNFDNQSASLAGTSPDLGCVYVAGGELYYNDESGNVVKITTSGNVNAGAGSITGLPSGTASASYGAGTFVWQSATLTPANTDTGSVILRNITASSKGLTLNPPNAMAADYSLVLPSLPGSTLAMTLDTSGNMGTGLLSGSQLSASAGIVGTQIASQTIAQGNLAIRATGTSVAAGGFAQSTSSGSFTTTNTSLTDVTNLSVTIVCTGRPIYLGLVHSGSATPARVAISHSTSTDVSGFVQFTRGSSTVVSLVNFQYAAAGITGPSISIPCGSFWAFDNPGAGTFTYKLQVFRDASATNISVIECELIAYEI